MDFRSGSCVCGDQFIFSWRMMWTRVPKHILVAIVLFLGVASATVYMMHGGVNSPDEAANLLFITSWRSDHSLSVVVPVAQTSSYPLFPRSTSPVAGSVVPSGFVGLPIIFGSVSIIFGVAGIFYLTILLTCIAAIGWWYLMKHIFSRAVADVSVWLFLFHPAVIYYSVRGLFPNMLLVDLLVIAFASVWYAYLHRARVMIVLAGCAALGAIAVRPPEALAVIGVSAVSAVIWGNTRVRKIAGGIFIGAALIAACILVARAFNWLPGGYQFVSVDSTWSLLFPFGVHLSRVWHTAITFIVRLFSPWVIVSSAGLLWWVWDAWKHKSFDKKIAAYITVIVPISFWLFILYGSWSFSEGAPSLGSSYVRYWLLHLLFRMPFAAVLLFAIVERGKLPARACARVFVVCAVVLGLWRAYAGVDGLKWMVGEVRVSSATVQNVESRVPVDAVIAVRSWDKYFFPERAVVQPFPQDVRSFGDIKELITRGTPVFAFIATLKDSDKLWLRDNGIAASAVQAYDVHTLYELHLWNEKR